MAKRSAWALGWAALVCASFAQAISVGSGGQASYGVPLSVPPGVAGMSPNLALSYADGGINGPVGVGWSVQGISTITRCPSSKVVDGQMSNGTLTLTGNNRPTVRFDRHDRLCLDGQRLIATNAAGNPLAATSDDAAGLEASDEPREFRTEKDSFARIRAYGKAGSVDGGPAYFRVWTKSGQVYEYGTEPGGATANARINAQGTQSAPRVAVWAVSRLSDSLGNYMDFKYEVREQAWGSGPASGSTLGQEWNVREIQYTGNSAKGLTPQNKVVFEYEDRSTDSAPADASEAYQGHSKNISIRRLKSIRTYVNTPTPDVLGPSANAIMVRAWSLGYETSPRSGRSRLSSVKECSDALLSKCLPASTFAYSDGAPPSFASHTGFVNSTLATTRLMQYQGYAGTLTGDFNGDGKTDILRWDHTPSLNEMHFSLGNGAFEKRSNFNLRTAQDQIFSQDGCYWSMAMDFNGDGRTDILRIVKPSCNLSATSRVYLSLGDGSFSAAIPVPAAISFDEKEAIYRESNVVCPAPYSTPSGDQGTSTPAAPEPVPASTCTRRVYESGIRFHVLDMNGDGLPDIVTTFFPGFTWYFNKPMPSLSLRCSDPSRFIPLNPEPGALPLVCTRVFLSQGNGQFAEHLPGTHPNQHETLYQHLPSRNRKLNPYWQPVYEADLDGDGLVDLDAAYSGLWRNRGDGSFESLANATLPRCALPIDFNGDQRADCLRPEATPSQQQLDLVTGVRVDQFNLTGPMHALYVKDARSNVQTVGVLVEDLDGDGRQDILRWSTTTSQNGVYLSNGDGSFRPIAPAGLTALGIPLVSADGHRSFISGDFLGNGSLQLLQVREDVSTSNRNVLLSLSGDRTPIDHLTRATTGTGVVFQVNAREPITTSTAYSSDRGTSHAATGQQVDLQPPSYVITSTSKTSPGFAAVETRYSYHGLKAERNGRGMLGFRETRQQTKAPNGDDLTVATRNLLAHPYIGVAGVTETYLGGLSLSSAQRLSRTTYSYCDKTSDEQATAISSGGVAPTPCATTAKVQRPYLYQSLEEGWDLNNASLALPTVRTTNTYKSWASSPDVSYGDVESILVKTEGTGPAGWEEFTKFVSNDYLTPITDGDRWILGRLKAAKVTQSAPNSLGSIATSKGTAPRADQVDGNVPITIGTLTAPSFSMQAVNTPVTATARLSNTSAANQSVSNIAVLNIQGGAFSLASHNCPTTLPAFESCDITVRFQPSSATVFTARVDAQLGTQSLQASVQGEGSPLSVDLADVGPVAVGSEKTATANVRNASTNTLSIVVPTSQSVSGSGFAFVSTTCTTNIAPSGQCTVTVKYAPSSSGLRTGSLTVRTASGVNANGELRGTGVSVSFPNVAFGNAQIGQVSEANAVLTNQSTASVSVSQAASVTGSGISIDAAKTTCTSGKVLTNGQSCIVALRFNPSTAGPASGEVQLHTNVGQLKSTWSTQVIAWGVTPLSFAKTAVSEDPRYADAEVFNNSTETLYFDDPFTFGVAVVNNGSARFFYDSTTCNTQTRQLAAGARCTVRIRFAPTQVGAQSGELRVRATQYGLRLLQGVPLTGEGVAVSLPNQNFRFRDPGGAWRFNATIHNDSPAAISLDLATLKLTGSPAFTLVPPTREPACSSQLPANTVCYFGLRFDVGPAGQDFTADLTISTSVGGLRAVASGSTRAWAGPEYFPNTAVNVTSAARHIVVANRSGASFTLPTINSGLFNSVFLFESTTCGSQLANGADCTVSVRFKPNAAGRAEHTVGINSSIGLIQMVLVGTGI